MPAAVAIGGRRSTRSVPARSNSSAWYRVTTAGDVTVTPLPPAINTVEQNAAFPSWLLIPTLP